MEVERWYLTSDEVVSNHNVQVEDYADAGTVILNGFVSPDLGPLAEHQDGVCKKKKFWFHKGALERMYVLFKVDRKSNL